MNKYKIFIMELSAKLGSSFEVVANSKKFDYGNLPNDKKNSSPTY